MGRRPLKASGRGQRRFCGYPACPACLPAASSPAPMTPNPSAPLLSTMLDALGRAGAPGREIAPRLDLMRSIGPGYAWREHRRRLASAPSDGRRAGYLALWSDAARQMGAQATDLSSGFVELRRGSARVVVWNHWVPLDDVVTIKLALEKPFVHRILAAAWSAGPGAPSLRRRRHRPCARVPRPPGGRLCRQTGRPGGRGRDDERHSHPGASSPRSTAREADLAAAADRAPGSRRQLPVPVPRREASRRDPPTSAAGAGRRAVDRA